MKKIILIFLLFCFCIFVYGEESSSDNGFSLSVFPRALIPLDDSSSFLSTGWGMDLSADYSFPGLNFLGIKACFDYEYHPIVTEDGVSVFSLLAGPDFIYKPIEKLEFAAYGAAGWYYGFIGGDDEGDGNYFACKAGLSAQYNFNEALSINLGADFSYKPYLLSGIGISLGGVIHPARIKASDRYLMQGNSIDMLESRTPGKSGSGLDVERIGFNQVFPVLYSYYDNNPIGKVALHNNEDSDITDVSISFYVDRYMDEPKSSPVIPRINSGLTASYDIYALFSENVLDITEGTKVAANVIIKYSYKGEQTSRKYTASMDLYDRNAITWDDDRKASAFVTAKDPSVLAFAKNVSGLVKQNSPAVLDKNLCMAMGIHESLRIYGLSYQIDPTTPFSEFSKDKFSVDFLQFPRQTLQYSAGDCDDLSILYSALLESVGIETAFITVPGHIYMAFALDMGPEEASRTFLNPENLITYQDKVWVPLEVTLIDDDFLYSWNEGAVEWQRYEKTGEAKIYPMHESWNEYKPVGLPGSAQILLPDKSSIVEGFDQALQSFIDIELAPRIDRYEKQIADSGGNPRYINKLGVLYARYGKNDSAKEAFIGILENQEYIPAMVNLGNLYYLEDNCAEALQYYKRALRIDPGNNKIIASAARANYRLGDFEAVGDSYKLLKDKAPELAAEFAYLGKYNDDAQRAANAGLNTEMILWEEE